MSYTANIAAEAGARQTYESLIKLASDEGTKQTLVHLLRREISHVQHCFAKQQSLSNPPT
ncbi:manganese catalase family protein [Pantanalinema rosaneae CENA516]|uniref:manganese catalase family protein n=1 Tax=Pantanalinema rosaneae TaxID=1620701 RepID=UPI003D701D72